MKKSINKLLTHSSFTANDARKVKLSTASLAYYIYIRKGRIRRLGRGIYQSTNYQYPSKSFQWEDLIEAVNSIPNGVISLISALAIYNITTALRQ